MALLGLLLQPEFEIPSEVFARAEEIAHLPSICEMLSLSLDPTYNQLCVLQLLPVI